MTRGRRRVNMNWQGGIARKLTAQCLAVYGTTCHLCGGEGATTADHLTPRSKGGQDHLDNLKPAHGACNYSRRDLDLTEWFALHPLPTRTALTPSREWTR